MPNGCSSRNVGRLTFEIQHSPNSPRWTPTACLLLSSRPAVERYLDSLLIDGADQDDVHELTAATRSVKNVYMPTHEIHLLTPKSIEVVNKDIEVVVYEDDEKLGTLRISKGSLDWTPRSGKDARHMRWREFDNLMTKRRSGRVHS